jgi:diguanylate cyclase (GGDEF)-like protein
MPHAAQNADLLMSRMRAELAELRRELAACRQRERQAWLAAQLDPLTGLPNRRLFEQQVSQQLMRHRASQVGMAMLFVDLDGFKTVNDDHGHGVGDALLKLVAQRLRHATRKADLVCRIGGDEFVCVLFDLHSEREAEAIERKLLATVVQPCHLGALQLNVRPSIGRSLYPRDGDSTESLLAHADQAMYRAKRRQLSLVTSDRSEHDQPPAPVRVLPLHAAPVAPGESRSQHA